jgi:hypothetical protein
VTLTLAFILEAGIESNILHILKNAMPALGKVQHTEGSRNFITSSSIQRDFFHGKILRYSHETASFSKSPT